MHTEKISCLLNKREVVFQQSVVVCICFTLFTLALYPKTFDAASAAAVYFASPNGINFSNYTEDVKSFANDHHVRWLSVVF